MPERVIIRKPEQKRKEGEYYLRVAGLCRFFKFAALALLVAFIVLVLLLFRSSVTYENLQYMLRDLGAAASSGDFSSVHFDSDGSAVTGLFRGDLAVVTSNDVVLYSPGGSRRLSKPLSYTSPAIAYSDRYFLIYDSDGSSFSLYNSYSKLYSENLGGKVSDADVSDSGSFAVMTSTREYPYVIYVYNKDFKRVKEYDRNRQVIDVRLDPEGKRLLLVSISVENGGYIAELSALPVEGDSADAVSVRIAGAFPISAEWTDDGFTLVCDSGMYFYSADGALLAHRDYGFGDPLRFSLGGSASAVITRKNAKHIENDVLLFDSRGNVLYNGTVYGELLDAEISGKRLFVLTEDELFMIDGNGTDISPVSAANPGGDRLLIYEPGAVTGAMPIPVVCGDGVASGVIFEASE